MLALFVESSPSDPADVPISAYRVATPGYFPASGIRMLQGRGFEDRDTPQSTPVAVVDQATAKKWWPGQSAIGKRISFQGPKGPWLTVIGVVGNVRHHGLNKNVFPTAYVPHSQTPFAGMMIAVRTATDPNLLIPDIRRIVTSLNQDLPIYKMIPFDQVVSESVVSKRFPVILVTSFSVFALFLAVLGVYGMVSYNTSRRTREIGIRMAVGARKADILRMVLGEGLGLTVAGLLFGFLVAIAFGRLISSMLFSTSPFEPLAFAGVSLIVIVVGLFASFFPAHRAIKIDPNRVMRYE